MGMFRSFVTLHHSLQLTRLQYTYSWWLIRMGLSICCFKMIMNQVYKRMKMVLINIVDNNNSPTLPSLFIQPGPVHPTSNPAQSKSTVLTNHISYSHTSTLLPTPHSEPLNQSIINQLKPIHNNNPSFNTNPNVYNNFSTQSSPSISPITFNHLTTLYNLPTNVTSLYWFPIYTRYIYRPTPYF